MAQGHLRKAARIAHANGLGQLLSPPEPGIVELAHDTGLEYQDDDLLRLLKARQAPSTELRVGAPETNLSRGELQLLSLLPTRAKNAEVAASLGVSINTVKTRLRRLYANSVRPTGTRAISWPGARIDGGPGGHGAGARWSVSDWRFGCERGG